MTGRSARACRDGRGRSSGWIGVLSWITRASSSTSVVHGSSIVKRSPSGPSASNTRVSPPLMPTRSTSTHGDEVDAVAVRAFGRRAADAVGGVDAELVRLDVPRLPASAATTQSRANDAEQPLPRAAPRRRAGSIGSNQRSMPPCSALYSTGCQCARCGDELEPSRRRRRSARGGAGDSGRRRAGGRRAAASSHEGRSASSAARLAPAKRANAVRARARRGRSPRARRRARRAAVVGTPERRRRSSAVALARQRRALGERRELGLGDLAAHRRQAAVGAGEQALARHEAQRACRSSRRSARASRRVGRDVDDADHHVLAVEQAPSGRAARASGSTRARPGRSQLFASAGKTCSYWRHSAAERLLPVDVGLDAVAVADVHGRLARRALGRALERGDAPLGGVGHVDVEGRLVELDDVDAVGLRARALPGSAARRRRTPCGCGRPCRRRSGDRRRCRRSSSARAA